MKSFCVISNYRCGTSTFTMQLAEKHGVPYCGEIFNKGKPFPIGNAVRNAPHGVKLEQVRQGAHGAFKIFPNQTNYDMLKEMMLAADKTYYLYRRDFQAQVRSWVGMNQIGDYGNNGFIKDPNRKLSGINGEYGETVRHSINANQSTVNIKARDLKQNWEIIRKLYKELPQFEVVCYEDYFRKINDWKPYNRQYKWLNKNLNFPEYDVESIFND